MSKKIVLKQEDFKEKQLAEQKGGLYKYYQYKEGGKTIVIRIYSTSLAVDYYNGIDLEDSDFADYEGDPWDKALEIANRFFNLQDYGFNGVPDEE